MAFLYTSNKSQKLKNVNVSFTIILRDKIFKN